MDLKGRLNFQENQSDDNTFTVMDSSLEGDTAVIQKGKIKLGINKRGNLIINTADDRVGLAFEVDGSFREVLNHGCLREGFGVSATKKSDQEEFWGGVVDIQGCFYPSFEGNIIAASQIVSTEKTAITVADVTTGPIKVTHDFHPSCHTKRLFEVTVTIENTSHNETLTDLRYRRVMDWDAGRDLPGGRFTNECLSLLYDAASDPKYVEYANDNGFSGPNPLVPASSLRLDSCPDNCPAGGVKDYGPFDQGSVFNFLFRQCGKNIELPPRSTLSFNIYYGAAPNKNKADTAVRAVGATIVSYASIPDEKTGSCKFADNANPYVFIFAFDANSVQVSKSSKSSKKGEGSKSKSHSKCSKPNNSKSSKKSKACKGCDCPAIPFSRFISEEVELALADSDTKNDASVNV